MNSDSSPLLVKRRDEAATRQANGTSGVPTPRTPLGRRLASLRSSIRASGTPQLGWRELEREVAERRGRSAGE